MIEVSKEAKQMNERCKQHHDMQNLMTSTEDIKCSSPESFRELLNKSQLLGSFLGHGRAYLCGICEGAGSIEGKSTKQILQTDSIVLLVPAMENNSVDNRCQCG